VQLGEPGSDGGHTIACGLDDELPLDIALDSPAPAEERRHRRMDIDAGSEAFLDERARDRVAEVADGDRGQDKNDISHKSLYFWLRVVVLFGSRG
jgi:hypothetical protein